MRIDHLQAKGGTEYGFPTGTYAYTATTPFVMEFDKEVAIQSFWVRLHRSPVVYLEMAQGARTIRVYNDGELMAETSFLLRSDEWYLIKPTNTNIFGNCIWISERTDVDSIIVSWGDSVNIKPKA